MLVLLWPALVLASAAALDVRFAVVEPEPGAALLTVAAARAGVAAACSLEDADEAGMAACAQGVNILVERRPLEPDQPLEVPRHVCAAAEDVSDDRITLAVISGWWDEAALVAGVSAAGRAGVPVVAAGRVDAACAQWDALALYPPADLALQAARALALEKGWERAALLHGGPARAAPLLAPDPDELRLLVRQLPPPADGALLRDLMLMLKQAGYMNFVVWSSAEQATLVLDAAQRVGLLSSVHSYILLSFEMHTQDLEPFSHGGANITALMFFDKESNGTAAVVESIRAEYATLVAEGEQQQAAVPDELSAGRVPGALLAAHDGALLAARALHALLLPLSADARADCSTALGAFHADTLLNYIRSDIQDDGLVEGATGVLTWEADGWRRNIVLQIVELTRGGELESAGVWSEVQGVVWRRRPRPVQPLPHDTMTNRTFTVLIAMNKPYVMRNLSTERLSGNARYEGFAIELIEKLSKMLHFNYTFVEQTDGAYGEELANGTWTGMLGRIIEDKENLTLAITDLTITEEREKAVDFTTPFMNLGIAILFKKPKPPAPKMFAFLLPFSSGVWLCLGVAYVGSSLVLYVVGRLCPEEWQNPYPCIEEPAALENQFTLGNALWFNLGAVLLQGSEVAPVGYSTRAVASIWWVFALVITSSYTANLASLLAKKSSNELIKNVEDLVHNEHGIKYGCKRSGATFKFFEKSNNSLFHEMYLELAAHRDELPKDNDIGVDMVTESDEKYAFLMESTTIEYTIERNCKVYMVGDLLDSKGYGIAMAKASPYRQELNLALLRMQEAGELREMKHTWWEERNGGGACKAEQKAESVKLEMNSFYGLFLVLGVGCGVGIALSCGDLALHAWRHPRLPDDTFLHNFADELRFVFRFELSAKPVTGPLIPSVSVSERTSSLEDEDLELDAGHWGEVEREGEGEDEAREENGGGATGTRSPAPGPRRRRSSMHTASVRLARHARRDSDTPHTSHTPARSRQNSSRRASDKRKQSHQHAHAHADHQC